MHDTRIAGLRPEPTVRLSPATAAKAGATAGDLADLADASGEVHLKHLRIEVRDDVRDGDAVILDGLADAPANRFAPAASVRLTNVRPARELVAAGGAV